MCPIDIEMDGNATLLNLVPLSDKVLDFAPGQDDVLENFDFDSFLHYSADDVQTFNFDTFNFDNPFITSYSSPCYETPLPSVPLTAVNTTACFAQPGVKAMPIEMKTLQQYCIILGQNYLSKIVAIHVVCKKIAGLDYPDVLQNQLLTASRTLTKLADMIVQHHEIIQETGVLGALERLVMECQCCLDHLDQGQLLDPSILSSGNSNAVDQCMKYIEDKKSIAYECLAPLSKLLRAFTWFAHAHLLMEYPN
jgi:hypothetical protein